MNKRDFVLDLEELINQHSMENDSDTPDFILARYIQNCLDAFAVATDAREDFYGRKKKPSQEKLECQP